MWHTFFLKSKIVHDKVMNGIRLLKRLKLLLDKILACKCISVKPSAELLLLFSNHTVIRITISMLTELHRQLDYGLAMCDLRFTNLVLRPIEELQQGHSRGYWQPWLHRSECNTPPDLAAGHGAPNQLKSGCMLPNCLQTWFLMGAERTHVHTL